MRSRAFTLIELLVVISIIALLIAILLPALSSARASSRLTQCLSNMNQHGNAIAAYAADNKELVPSMQDWYALSGPAADPALIAGTTVSPVTAQVGLKSEVVNGTVVAARPLNEYTGDDPFASLCPDDKGDSFQTTVDSAYEAYGTSYQPHWQDSQDTPYFGVATVFGAIDLNGNVLSRSDGTQRAPRRMDSAITNGGQTYSHSWSEKFMLGDFPWHGNRPLGDPKNSWHIGASETQRASSMLFGDGHAEFFKFEDDYNNTGGVNLNGYDVDPNEHGFW